MHERSANQEFTAVNAHRRDDLERARQWHPEKPEGLARTLARAGYGSRNRAAEIVRSGRVRLDGKVVVDPSAPVGPQQAIELDGKPLVEATRRYFALHKPLRVICRPGEPGGYKLISEFFPFGLGQKSQHTAQGTQDIINHLNLAGQILMIIF